MRAAKMNAVHAPIQTSMAFTYDTCGVSAFNPVKKPKKRLKKRTSLHMNRKKTFHEMTARFTNFYLPKYNLSFFGHLAKRLVT